MVKADPHAPVAKSREWFQRSLVEPITDLMLRELITDCPWETQWLEYKSGLLRNKTDEDIKTAIRRYVAGFANSDGGLLIIGVDEAEGTRPVTVDGFVLPKTVTNAQGWAAQVLAPLTGYLTRAPSIWPIACAEGTVIAIAVQRSLTLVPVFDANREVLYLRIGDSTSRSRAWDSIVAPDYLKADLVLGRRNTPLLRITDAGFDPLSEDRTTLDWISLPPLLVTIVNEGFSAAKGVRVVVLAESHQDHEDYSIPLRLYEHVEVANDVDLRLHEASPLGREDISVFGRGSWSVPGIGARVGYEATLAIFVVPENGMPTWNELAFEVYKSGVVVTKIPGRPLLTRPRITHRRLVEDEG